MAAGNVDADVAAEEPGLEGDREAEEDTDGEDAAAAAAAAVFLD